MDGRILPFRPRSTLGQDPLYWKVTASYMIDLEYK
jgi:hypothetical protein